MEKLRKILVATAMLCALPNIGFAQDVFIAGVDPSKRPEGAPVIEGVDKSGTWYPRALQGVVQPYPYSLHFLENQGNWFNPFIHPGMPGRYDIRGWHKPRKRDQG
jgi:hypothetical protein